MRKRLTRRVALAGIATGIGGAAWAARRGGVPGVAPPPTPNFTGLSLTNYTWTTSGAAVTIGALVPTADNGGDVTGATVTVAGPNSADFQFTNGGVIPCAFQAKAGVTAGEYADLTMEISKSGIGNSPYTSAPFTVTGSASSGQIALVRTINNAGAGTPAIAFWSLGHPFIDGDVPTGSIVSAKLGGTTVPVQGFCTKLHADGSMAWSDLHVDLSGAMPGPAASADLVLSVVAGSWSTTTSRTNADWTALNDTVEITNLSMVRGNITGIVWSVVAGVSTATVTTAAPHGLKVQATNIGVYSLPIAGVTPAAYNGTRNCTASGASTFWFSLGTDPGPGGAGTYGDASASDLDGAGTWVATFDAGATNLIYAYGQGPLGLRLRVKAPFYNGATKHRFLMAVMEYWCTQKANGDPGPVMSIGPVIENALIFKANPNQFNYDLAFKRNGSTVRSETGVLHPALAKMTLPRYDGQGDWTSDDPVIHVTQDYGLLGRTRKLPFYAPGINYTGGPGTRPKLLITAINTSTGAITADPALGVYPLFGPMNTTPAPSITKRPNSISLTVSGGSMPTGLSAEPVTYWVSYIDPSTFYIYDNLANAIAAGVTGRIVPGALGGVTLYARLAVRPTMVGKLNQAQGNPGGDGDICVIPEIHVAAVVATSNQRDWQRMARVHTYAWMGAPVWALKDDTPDAKPHLISCISTALTPVGLRPSKTAVQLVENWSADVGAGAGKPPTGGKNQWSVQNNHMTSPVYVPWLLEGGAILQSTCVEHGARAIYEDGAVNSRRNCTINGTAYNGISCVLYQNVDSRQAAWCLDALGMAAFAATYGSDDETMLLNTMQQNVDAQQRYMNYKGVLYTNTGSAQYYEFTYPPETATRVLQGPNESTFMADFASVVWPFVSDLVDDRVTNMPTVAAYFAKRMMNYYNGGWGWYATAYRAQVCISESQALLPEVFVTDVKDIGFSAGSYASWTIDLATGVIHMNADGMILTVNIANGDKIRPVNYQNQGGNDLQPWPSPFVDETDYWIVELNLPALTMKLSDTQGGAAIIPTKGTTTKTGATGLAGQKVILMADTSGIFIKQPTPNNAGGSIVTDSTGGVIPAGARVVSLVTNVSVTLDQNITGAGVTAGDTLTFTCPRLSAFYLLQEAVHGNPNTGTISFGGTNEGSYLAVERMALAGAVNRGVTGADTAYGSTTSGNVGVAPRYTGNNNAFAQWSGVAIP